MPRPRLRLRVDAGAEMHRRVDPERHAPRLVDGARLAARMVAHECDRVGVRRIVLLVHGRDGLEGDRELGQDGAPLRRGRRENERRRHRGFAATQISSAGQRRAQSTEKAS